MRKFCVTIFVALLAGAYLVGSDDAPPPVGPAAEAMVGDIEITMDEPVEFSTK